MVACHPGASVSLSRSSLALSADVAIRQVVGSGCVTATGVPATSLPCVVTGITRDAWAAPGTW